MGAVLKLMFHCCSHCYGKHEIATCTYNIQKQQIIFKTDNVGLKI